MLECVVNISEGAEGPVLAAICKAAGADLLDVHRDVHHNRAVLTMVGEEAPRAVTSAAVRTLDLRTHQGVHPRIGVVDVVPFVPLGTSTMADAVEARDRFCRWAADTLDLPCFAYGPERPLPEIRQRAFNELAPTTGPTGPHPTAGAVAVGARPPLVAYNVWLDDDDLDLARRVARQIRGPQLRALGLQVGDRVQVSMNLVAPESLGPASATDLVAALAPVAGCELVGLIPKSVLHAIDPSRWKDLDLDEDRTIEARLDRRSKVLES